MGVTGYVAVTVGSESEDDDNDKEEDNEECSKNKKHIDTNVCACVCVTECVHYVSRVYAGRDFESVANLPHFPDCSRIFIRHY